jgi:hypothetical protein
MTRSDDVDLWTLGDLATPWALRVAVTLRVADHPASGKCEIGELARLCGADAEALHQLLRHLASRVLFAEPAPGIFALADAGRGLLEPGARLGFDLDGFGGRMAHAWGSLLAALRTGAPAYHTVFGRAFWDDLPPAPAAVEASPAASRMEHLA